MVHLICRLFFVVLTVNTYMYVVILFIKEKLVLINAILCCPYPIRI